MDRRMEERRMVPVMRFSWRGWRLGWDASPTRPRRGSSSPSSESLRMRASGMPVAEAIVENLIAIRAVQSSKEESCLRD